MCATVFRPFAAGWAVPEIIVHGDRHSSIFSFEQADGTRIRALGDLPSDVTLRAVVRIGGIWIRHAQYGWHVRVNTFELIDHLDRRGVVAFLVAYTTHLGPVRAAEAVERFGDRVFEVLHNSPEDLCVIKGITPDRARVIRDSFSAVATIANVDSWLRHIGLGKADARRVREAYGDNAARVVRENPYPLADQVHGIGFLTADSLRLMLGPGRDGLRGQLHHRRRNSSRLACPNWMCRPIAESGQSSCTTNPARAIASYSGFIAFAIASR